MCPRVIYPPLSTNLRHMDSHDLSPFGSELKAYILEATRTWYAHHEFSDSRCDTVCIWYNENFLGTRGWNKTQIYIISRI